MRTGSGQPSSVRIRPASPVASREWPPSAKKLSSAPTAEASSPSTSAKSAASRCSRPGAGGREPAPVRAAGAGSADRSSLPLAPTGSAGSSSTSAGTM
ncbi:hypothetical protein GXW82_14045 [Streptacidiphilus sp. 4-A2]|nr:hypothetical protein [Streptacidiphilus sp. 4-A2]